MDACPVLYLPLTRKRASFAIPALAAHIGSRPRARDGKMLAWRSLQKARYTAVRRLTCEARARMAPYVWPTMVATPTMATPQLRSKQLQSRLRHSASADPAGLLLGLAAAAGLLSCSAPAASEAAGSRNRLISRLTGELPASMERVVCLNDRQIEQAVSLLNAILDLDYFTEEEEQLIFRHAVCAVLNAVQHKLPQFFQHSQK